MSGNCPPSWPVFAVRLSVTVTEAEGLDAVWEPVDETSRLQATSFGGSYHWVVGSAFLPAGRRDWRQGRQDERIRAGEPSSLHGFGDGASVFVESRGSGQ